mgnify:CR=1 FL=1
MTKEEEGGELSAEEREEIASARTLLSSLEKACKSFVLYLPNNPLRTKFSDELKERMDRHFEEFDDLRLGLDDCTMTLGGMPVYENRDRRDSLAFRMCAESMRSLTFRKGLTGDELALTLEILSRVRSDEEDDDIVTDFWMSEMAHVIFTVVEEEMEVGGSELGARPEDEGRRKEGMARLRREVPLRASEPSRQILSAPQAVLALSEEELDGLRVRLDFEENRDPLKDLEDILLAILLVEEETGVFREFVEEMAKLGSDLIATGRIEHATAVAGILTVLSTHTDMGEEHRHIVIEAKKTLLTEAGLEALERTLDDEEVVGKEAVRALALSLGRENVVALCELLGKVEKREMRKALVDGLVEVTRDFPEDFYPFLEDSRWYLVRNIAHILRMIATERAGRALRVLVEHRDHRVRREAMLYFVESGDKGAIPALISVLPDSVGTRRGSGARGRGGKADPLALPALRGLVDAPGFKERELPEREAVYEALGALDAGEMVPLLREMLMRKHPFSRQRELEEAACAVAGLRGVGTAAALALLPEAAAAKKGEVLVMVEKAIRALRAGSV